VTLRFNEKTHTYTLDGKRVPGVTSILGKALPKPALTYWSAKCVAEWVADNPDGVENLRSMGRGPMVQALKGVPWEKRDAAAVRGTDVHALAEKILHGQEVEVPDYLMPYVEGYVRFLDDFDLSPVLTEQPVAHRIWRYGGKFDAVVTIGRGPWAGRLALLDWKTSSGVYGETALQVAAYARAEFYAPEPDQELPLPQVDCTGVVHIQEGSTTLHPLAQTPAEIDEHMKVFTHVTYLAQRQDWLKGLVGLPMEIEQEQEAIA
jgi:hypothetical protein